MCMAHQLNAKGLIPKARIPRNLTVQGKEHRTLVVQAGVNQLSTELGDRSEQLGLELSEEDHVEYPQLGMITIYLENFKS